MVVLVILPPGSQLLGCCCQRGSPIPKGVRGRAGPLGPKLYATAVVPIDSLLQRRYRTLQAEHLFIVYRCCPHRGEGCVPPTTTRMEP